MRVPIDRPGLSATRVAQPELESGEPKVRGINQEEEQNETLVSSIAQMPVLNDSIILSDLAVDQRVS